MPRFSAPLRRAFALAALALSVAFAIQASHQPGGLQNAGFEQGAIGSAPLSWTVAAAVDRAVTTGGEGSAQFQIYQDRQITVTPFRGAQMLRLGTPKRLAESQPRGSNAVTQTFHSLNGELVLAARFFSFEHRGNDKFILSVVDPASPTTRFPVSDAVTDGPFTLPLPGVAPAVCSLTPCSLAVRMNKRGPLLDSGFRQIKVSGLPTDGRELVVRYEVLTASNTAHASWAYFDDVNRAPVARIAISPPGGQLEGDFVFFDCGASSDPDGDALTCTWELSGATIEPRTVTGPYAVFNFPENDPTLQVTLTVSDGSSVVATSTAFATSGALNVANGAPLVNALNAEVEQGRSVELVCRYLDFGVIDSHSATLQVAGETLATTAVTENQQAYATGVVRATFDASDAEPGDLAGSCSVVDDEGASSSDEFVVRVLEPTSGRGEPTNNSSTTAPALAADWSYAYSLETPQDVDVFELRMPDGSPLPIGAELELSLTAGADYDLIVLSAVPGQTPFGSQPLKTAPFLNSPFLNSPFLNSPFLNSPFLNSPFLNSPFLNSPFLNSPFLNSPFLNSPFLNSPFLNSPIGLDQIPLSQLAGAPDPNAVSGADVSLDELGSFNLAGLENEALVVKSISARLGSATEQALVRVGGEETALYVAVVAHDGAFAAAPYALSVQASRPLDRVALLGVNCEGTPRVPAAQATSALEVLHAAGGAPKTIGVIQRQRFQLAHGLDDAEFAAWLASIAPALDHPALAMRLVSVPSVDFDAADSAPCDVTAQNGAAAALKAAVQAQLAAFPSAQAVVLLGDQSILPHYAELDGTDVANERFYGGDALVREDTPLAATLAGGFNLTDAYYTAPGLPFGGRTLWVETLPVGRLAKDPAGIAAELASFAAKAGVITPTRALATGYDFFADGTAANASVLETLAPTTALNDASWTADDLRCEAFGIASASSGPVCRVPELTAINLHGTHFAGLSANGFATGDFSDFVDTDDLAGGQTADTFTASIGCHTGLSMPAEWSIPQAFGLRVDPANDWAQQAGVQLRPINYGLGHSDFADRGSEGLVTRVLERAAAGATLGEALVGAKAAYLLGLRQVDVYDEDSVISLALHGLPQWRISEGVPPAPPPPPSGTPFGTLQLAVIENGATTTIASALATQSSPKGAYLTADGGADAPHARATQPTLAVFEERSATGTRVHDVALRGGTFTVLPGFDPVLATFTQEWLQDQPEPKACVEATSPTQLGTVNTLDLGGQTLQTLLFTAGQFECTLPLEQQGSADVVGNERVWTSATIEALHPTSAALDGDFTPPTVTQQDVSADPESGDVTVTLDASDANGLREVIALVFEDTDGLPGGAGSAVSYTTGAIAGAPGPHTLVLPGALGKLISLQYIDGAGNLLLKSFKGKLFEAVPVEIQTSIFSIAGSTTIVVTIGSFDALGAPVLTVDFGDGTSASHPLVDANGDPTAIVQLQPDGSAIARVTHDYSGATAAAFTVVATVSADGAGGSDSAVLTSCADAIGDFADPSGDIVQCSFASQGTHVTFGLFVRGAISNQFQYRVDLPHFSVGQLKYNNGNAQGPAAAQLVVTPSGTNGLLFDFEAGPFGWNGIAPLAIEGITQSGIPGAPGVGFADTTGVLFFTP
ncbi:MAG TPA: hypothetical protein VFT98_16075 [Myxococcota bacterium]|nr:hypothetical protein [Myxococcota bacterium]